MPKALSIPGTSAVNPDMVSKFVKKVQHCKGGDIQLLACKFFITFQLQPRVSKRIKSAGKPAWLIRGAANINTNSADCCRNSAVGKGGVIHIG